MTDGDKPRYKEFFGYIFIIVIAVGVSILFFSRNSSTQRQTSEQKESTQSAIQMKNYSSPPKMTIDAKKKYSATLTTNKGPITLELFASEVPIAVNNFVFLAREGFYDGTIFHRIVKDFMIQGGDPKGDGTGGPGYTFDDEKITRDYKRGIVAMANRGSNTNGSQFFIMHKDYDLPKNYVIFGQMKEGIEVVDAIANAPTVDNGSGEKSKPTEEIKLEKIIINEE